LCEGAELLFTASSENTAASLEHQLQSSYRETFIRGFALNLSSLDSINELITSIRADRRLPSVIVHCARSAATLATKNGIPAWSDWQLEYAIDVIGTYNLTIGLQVDLAEKGGSVILISSIYGMVAVNTTIYSDPEAVSPIHYSCAKAAQIQLMKELSVRLAPSIRVNAVSYGGVEGRAPADFIERYSSQCPARRMLCGSDLSGAVVFLASDDAAGITGHNLVVDGGWTAW
jgi:NAD(P)-dependent dehydrogenase (short-subunit alcohol dehydrogenase family)